MVLKVIQINLHHSKAASATLCHLCIKNNIDIALIQEPWVHKGRVRGLNMKSSKIIYNPQGIPRCAIVCNSNLKVFPLNNFISRDFVAVSLDMPLPQGGNTSIIMAAAYFPGDDNSIPPVATGSFINYSNQNNMKFIIGCDANAHHTVWGSTDVNNRGELLLNFIQTNNLFINNIGNEPTFVTTNRAEVLDITLSNSYATNFIENWHVSKEPSMSDHRYICFDMNFPQRLNVTTRLPKNTNWEQYRAWLQYNLIGTSTYSSTPDEIDRYAEEINEAITDAYYKSSPLITFKGNRNVIWWNEALEQKRKETRKQFNKAKRTKNWAPYKIALTAYNNELKKCKRKSWRDFCERIDNLPKACRLQKALSLDHKNPLGSIRKTNGEYTSSAKETLEVLMATHFPNCIILENENSPDYTEPSHFHIPRAAHKLSKEIFTENSIRWAIKSFGPFKAPGGDGIYPIFLQRGLEILLPFLVILFRASLSLEYIPICWRKVRLLFIPKLGNTASDQAKSVRGISLTSFMLKSMEKVLDGYIRATALQIQPLNPSQHAYQTGKSTETALHDLTRNIEDTLHKKELLAAAFMDIQGAFDNTQFEVINRIATARGIHPTILGWIVNMLKTRQITSTLSGTSITISPTRGCPQGGVLSPLIWLLVMDELLLKLNQAGIDTIGYADDLAVLIRGKFDSTVSERTQLALNITMSWCSSVGLDVNPQKSTLVIFTNRRKVDWHNPVLNGSTLPLSKEVKYLGVLFDHKLNWNSHLNYISSKATRVFCACQHMFGKTWGLKPKMTLWMYFSLVRPIITYAALVWWPKTDQTKTRNTLNKLQRLVCLSMTGAFSTSPTVALETLLGICPLYIHLQKMAANSAVNLKLANQLTTSTSAPHSKILNRVNVNEELIDNSDCMAKQITWTKNFVVKIFGRSEILEVISTLPNNACIWYTDGSKTDNGTGAGVFGPRHKHSEALGLTPTVFQAETYAIVLCIIKCLERNYKHANIYIISDSQAALMAIDSNTINSKLVWDCINYLNKLAEHNKITLLWAPGHVGIAGNEEADVLAKIGSETNFIGPEPCIGFPKTLLKNKILLWERNLSRVVWESSDGMRQAKKFLGPKYNHCSLVRELDRISLRALTWFATGHGPFRSHLVKLGLESDDNCRFCFEDSETSEHIICECIGITAIRIKHLGIHYVKLPLPKSIPFNDIISFLKRIYIDFLTTGTS